MEVLQIAVKSIYKTISNEELTLLSIGRTYVAKATCLSLIYLHIKQV